MYNRQVVLGEESIDKDVENILLNLRINNQIVDDQVVPSAKNLEEDDHVRLYVSEVDKDKFKAAIGYLKVKEELNHNWKVVNIVGM